MPTRPRRDAPPGCSARRLLCLGAGVLRVQVLERSAQALFLRRVATSGNPQARLPSFASPSPAEAPSWRSLSSASIPVTSTILSRAVTPGNDPDLRSSDSERLAEKLEQGFVGSPGLRGSGHPYLPPLSIATDYGVFLAPGETRKESRVCAPDISLSIGTSPLPKSRPSAARLHRAFCRPTREEPALPRSSSTLCRDGSAARYLERPARITAVETLSDRPESISGSI